MGLLLSHNKLLELVIFIAAPCYETIFDRQLIELILLEYRFADLTYHRVEWILNLLDCIFMVE